MHRLVIENLYPEDEIRDSQNKIYGFMATIEPPVNINPEVVSRVIQDGALNSNVVEQATSPFTEALLVGSTHEKTIIYSKLERSVMEDSSQLSDRRRELVVRISELVGLLGIEEIDFEDK